MRDAHVRARECSLRRSHRGREPIRTHCKSTLFFNHLGLALSSDDAGPFSLAFEMPRWNPNRTKM